MADPRTEKEKMLAGELYDASDAVLTAERQRARRLLHELNALHYQDAEQTPRIYRELFPNCGPGLHAEPPFFCDYGWNIHAGENVFFNFNCVVLDVCRVTIGERTMMGPAVQIYTALHPMNAAERVAGPEYGAPVTIGAECWIGGGAIVLPGVMIGDGAVIGAGSVVTRDVPAGMLAVGNPARAIRKAG